MERLHLMLGYQYLRLKPIKTLFPLFAPFKRTMFFISIAQPKIYNQPHLSSSVEVAVKYSFGFLSRDQALTRLDDQEDTLGLGP